MAASGITSGWLQWPLAILMSGVVALLIGLLSLRTRGIFFIMITLALAQLIYYLGNGASRSEEHTSELQSLLRNSYAVFCLKKKRYTPKHAHHPYPHKSHTQQLKGTTSL